jgi:hypothetical protein
VYIDNQVFLHKFIQNNKQVKIIISNLYRDAVYYQNLTQTEEYTSWLTQNQLIIE